MTVAQDLFAAPGDASEAAPSFELLPFQRQFLRALAQPRIRIAALTLPRGNGKSSLASWIAEQALTPGTALHVPGAESHIVSGSVGQSRRTTFKLLRMQLGKRPGVYRIADSMNDARATHLLSAARISVLAANAKTAQGLVDVPLVICDEPGAWEVTGGLAVWEAIETAIRKPTTERRMKVVVIGTLAPALGGWWHDLVNQGSTDTIHVQALIGRRDRWHTARELRRCNPLVAKFPEQWAELRAEQRKAHRDSRLKATFLSYHLNAPSRDESRALLTVGDWTEACRRPVPDRDGRPVVGIDMGGGRAWSSAAAWWPSGRVEACALAPGIPDIADQETRDLVSRGSYQRLVDSGQLIVARGYRVPPAELLLEAIRPWQPASIVCDRFRLADILDARPSCPVLPRAMLPSEKSADIRALRRAAADGPLAPAPEAQPLIEASLGVAVVRHDSRGNIEMVKSGSNNTARDDVAAALVLAAGAAARRPKPRKLRIIG